MYNDFYEPERPSDNNDGRTIFQVPSNNLGINVVREDEDVFKGKTYMVKNTSETLHAERMVKERDLYYVYFSNGKKLSIQEINDNLVLIEDDPLNIKPNSLMLPEDQLLFSNNTKIQQTHSNPILELLKKLKINKTDINIKIELNLPKKELYNAIVDSYDDDVDSILVDYLFNGENIQSIKNSLKIAIEEFYGRNINS
jgi:hypothetical protein